MYLVEPSFRGLLSGLGGLQIYIGWAALLGQFWREHGKQMLYVMYSQLSVLHSVWGLKNLDVNFGTVKIRNGE